MIYFATFVIPFFEQDNSISFHCLCDRVSPSFWLDILSHSNWNRRDTRSLKISIQFSFWSLIDWLSRGKPNTKCNLVFVYIFDIVRFLGNGKSREFTLKKVNEFWGPENLWATVTWTLYQVLLPLKQGFQNMFFGVLLSVFFPISIK